MVLHLREMLGLGVFALGLKNEAMTAADFLVLAFLADRAICLAVGILGSFALVSNIDGTWEGEASLAQS